MDIKPSLKFPGTTSSIGSHHSFDRFVEKFQDKPQTKVAEKAAVYEPFNTERRPIDDIEPDLIEKIRKDFEIDVHGGPTTYLGGMAADLVDDPSDDSDVLNGVQAAIEIIKANLFPLIQTSGDFLENEILANELLGKIVVDDVPRFAYKRKDMVKDIDGTLAREFMIISERMHVLALAARDKKILSFLRNESARSMQDPTDRIVRHTSNGAKQLEVKESPRFSANYRTLSRAARDPREEQKLIRKQLGAVLSGEYDALFAHTPASASEAPADDHINTLPRLLSSEMQELQFEILPGDTNLRELSERVYDESSDTEKVRVDLGRIQVLEEMRTLFGEDHCYFARGEASGNSYTDENGESINEDFIILVMQHHGDTGQVEREDALAISPIARRHAVFYMRQDASEDLSWREVYRLTKKQAQDLGVRKLKFVAPEGIDTYTAMKEKLFTLATCRTEDFHSELRYDAKTGTYAPKTRKIRAGMMRSIQIAA